MKQLKSILTEEIEKGSVNRRIEKIIFDIIFQHVKDMVFIMKVEKGPHFRHLFVNESVIQKAQGYYFSRPIPAEEIENKFLKLT